MLHTFINFSKKISSNYLLIFKTRQKSLKQFFCQLNKNNNFQF